MYECNWCKKKNRSKNDPKSSQVECPLRKMKENRVCVRLHDIKIRIDQKWL